MPRLASLFQQVSIKNANQLQETRRRGRKTGTDRTRSGDDCHGDSDTKRASDRYQWMVLLTTITDYLMPKAASLTRMAWLFGYSAVVSLWEPSIDHVQVAQGEGCVVSVSEEAPPLIGELLRHLPSGTTTPPATHHDQELFFFTPKTASPSGNSAVVSPWNPRASIIMCW